jgi:hypothetical protein
MTPDTDSTETELTLLKLRLDQNQSCPHTRCRSQFFRRTLVVSKHCFSSSDRRRPHITTLFDADRSQSWAALSGLTEEKDAIFLLVSYWPSHIIFYGTNHEPMSWIFLASLSIHCMMNSKRVITPNIYSNCCKRKHAWADGTLILLFGHWRSGLVHLPVMDHILICFNIRHMFLFLCW